MKKTLFIAFICFALQGCAAAILGGTVATGIAVHDHRAIAIRYQDEQIISASYKKIDADAALDTEHEKLFNKSRIVITSFDRTVLILGQVPNEEYKNQITALVTKVKDIRKIYNQLTIGAPSTLSERNMDAWITAKVRTQLLSAKKLQSTRFKIITERQYVYLVGRAPRMQAELAADAARRVEGVRKVILAIDDVDSTTTTEDTTDES